MQRTRYESALLTALRTLGVLLCSASAAGAAAQTCYCGEVVADDVLLAADVEAADVGGDGNLDLLSASRGGGGNDGRILYHRQTATGFTTTEIADDATDARDLFIADGLANKGANVDGDMDFDVLVAEYEDDEVVWYELDDGTWTKTVIDAAADKVTAVYAADTDGNGTNETIYSAAETGKVRAYAHDGTSWQATSIANDVTGARALVAFNINPEVDNDVDVIAAGTTGMYLLENIGIGGWKAKAFVTASQNVRSIQAVNLVLAGDPDTRIDLLVADGTFVRWYQNKKEVAGPLFPGGVDWVQHKITDKMKIAYDARAVDVDKDGVLDVVGVDGDDHEVSWFERTGLTAWKEHLVIDEIEGDVRAAGAADFDKDGDLEIFSAWEADDLIAVHEQAVCAQELPYFGGPGIDLLGGQTAGPFLGEVYDPVIDHTAFEPFAVFDYLGFSLLPTPFALPTPIGPLLIDPSTQFATAFTVAGQPFQIPIVANCDLAGSKIYLQGLSLTLLPIPGVRLTNTAIEATLGGIPEQLP